MLTEGLFKMPKLLNNSTKYSFHKSVHKNIKLQTQM